MRIFRQISGMLLSMPQDCVNGLIPFGWGRHFLLLLVLFNTRNLRNVRIIPHRYW